MSFLESIFAGEDELGKKDDDRRPNRNSGVSSTWLARKPPTLPRKRRLVYGLIACFALFLFFKNIPPPDPFAPQPARNRPIYDSQPSPNTKPKVKGIPESTQEAPPRPDVPSDAENHYYEGPIKFFKLAASLHAISRLQTWSDADNNVLFAASNLKSAAEIIPLACEMARIERNVVHLALMGRDDLAIDEIKSLNGADSECNIQWHGRTSTDPAGETSIDMAFARCPPKFFLVQYRLSYGGQCVVRLRLHQDLHAPSSHYNR